MALAEIERACQKQALGVCIEHTYKPRRTMS